MYHSNQHLNNSLGNKQPPSANPKEPKQTSKTNHTKSSTNIYHAKPTNPSEPTASSSKKQRHPVSNTTQTRDL
jgi:hypothetical protein